MQRSDMLRRLIGQYFMIHEYVRYHVDDGQTIDIRQLHRQAVLGGINNLLAILRPHLQVHEILNYCVSLYYNRSMVSFAASIMDNFSEIAFCPGEATGPLSFPENLTLITSGKRQFESQLHKIEGEKIIVFVSEQCPVSMVAAVTKVRQYAEQKKGVAVIVAPLEELSATHLAMNRMISNGVLLFINDEQWRKVHLTGKIKLPRIVKLGAKQIVHTDQ